MHLLGVPSLAYETLGKSILESYAYARPVVASDLGSRREFVEHGVTACFMRPVIAASSRIPSGFCSTAPIGRENGANGRARVQARHDPERHMQRLSESMPGCRYQKTRVIRRGPKPRARQSVRVAFIGGRGVVSKYSGIESWYEQAGHELARLGMR